MADTGKKVCPQCQGEKVVAGVGVCDSEWRGTQIDDQWNDCKCAPERECPTCGGTGYVDA